MFVRKLLKKINLYLGLRLVLIIDNTATYYAIEIAKLCKAVGVRLKYLAGRKDASGA